MDTASSTAGVATAKAPSNNNALVVTNNNNNSDNHPETVASSSTSAVEITSTTARDNIYCLELAQRSVARAALHLGIPSMTQETLAVLGDVLCQYMERLSAVLAQGVESSGRSTQHVHALDMLQAVELCTSPAVSRVHFTNHGGGETGGAKSSDSVVTTRQEDNRMEDQQNDKDSSSSQHQQQQHQQQQQHPPGAWQGLAAFCFGPTWQEEPSTKEAQEEEAQLLQLQQTGGAGGKVGPSALVTEATSAMQEESAKDVQEGWRAPFPDEVVPFPLTAAYASHHTSGGVAVDVSGSSSRVSNPHPMTHAEVLMALYGNASKTAMIPSKAISSNPSSSAKDDSKKTTTAPTAKPSPIADIVKGKDLISPEEAEKERKQKEAALKDVPESVWGGMTPASKDKDATTATATTDDQTMTDAEGATKETEGDKKDATTTDGDKKDADTTTSAGNKRKLNETESTPGTPSKDADAKKDSASPAVAGSKPEAMETDDATKSSTAAATTAKDGDANDDAKPAKKKVKLEDGTARSTKTATPSKKKKSKDTAAEKAAKEAAEKKEAEEKAAHQASIKAAAAAAEAAKAAAIAAAGGRTYDYVPTFYPPIPNMLGPSSAAAAHAELAHLRKTTVVELLDPKKADPAESTAALASVSSLAAAGSDITANARAATTTTFGLRSALAQLGGTNYWGSGADHPATAADGSSSNVVPAGRSAGATAAPTGAAAVAAAQGPIVPLGRASGSRVSRILEGSMDAVAMQ